MARDTEISYRRWRVRHPETRPLRRTAAGFTCASRPAVRRAGSFLRRCAADARDMGLGGYRGSSLAQARELPGTVAAWSRPGLDPIQARTRKAHGGRR